VASAGGGSYFKVSPELNMLEKLIANFFFSSTHGGPLHCTIVLLREYMMAVLGKKMTSFVHFNSADGGSSSKCYMCNCFDIHTLLNMHRKQDSEMSKRLPGCIRLGALPYYSDF
jgi:hypothetical protein